MAIPFAASAQVAYVNQSSPNSNQPLAMPALGLVSTGGDVTATIESFDFHGGPGYTNNQLYAGTTLGNLQLIGTNYQFGNSVDLGNFSAGTDIIVAMFSQESDWYYTGSNAGLNFDGINHADLYATGGGTAVDFEDLGGNPVSRSDWNYGDAKVFVSNAAPTPEPMSFAALGLGVIGLVARRRRK